MFPHELEIAVIAPFPGAARVQEGWMSRIASVDRILDGFKRLYVHFAPHHQPGIDDEIQQHTPLGWEICLNPTEPAHIALFDDIVHHVRGIYVHTVHLAEHVVAWLPTGKFVVDIHGIVPEEERLLGRPELAPKYEVVERHVLTHARCAIVVTNAMGAHFRAKYPDLAPRFLNLPIVETYREPQQQRVEDDTRSVQVVYSGGIQPWQNVEAMLQLLKHCNDFAEFTFLSHEFVAIQDRAQALRCHGKASFSFCQKADLPSLYVQHAFGLVLRDAMAVNHVACPTKLSEYLHFGLVPIVRSPKLGDFEELGYWYITEEEFREGFFPDVTTRRWMSAANQHVIQQLVDRFATGARQLVGLFT